MLTSLILVSASPANAWFGTKPGSECSNKNELKKIDDKTHICAQARDGKNRWLINTNPKQVDSALGLILSSCGSTYDGEYRVNLYPRLMYGTLIQRAIANGGLTPSNKEKIIIQYDIDKSDSISNNFEMAITLDPKWKRINSLWISGVNAAYSRYARGGINPIEAINSSQNNLGLIESICKVAKTKGDVLSKNENRTLPKWIERAVLAYK
jgi:hypothetical protein